jgi:two-component system sensor histidine kinase/response regulator
MNSSFISDDCSILVVDDISENIQIIGSVLLQQGYQVSYALSGPEALMMVSAKHYDLILLDILMPGMDGYEVCTQLKQDDKSSDIPIIFLTAKTDPGSIVKGFKLGAVDYLGKPFNADELLARVKTQLQIRKQTKKLEEYNSVLEEKVKERTRELETSHKELAVLEKAKSNFLQLISHEMRTPLNILNGFILELHTSLQSPDQKDAIRYLKQSSDKLINLAESALLITELQSGKYKLNFSSINIREICESAIASFADEINDKAIKIVFNFQEDVKCVNGDFNLFSRCTQNLIHNAIKYSPKGGIIKLITNKTAVFTNLIIEDEGSGFTDDQLAKSLKPFGKSQHDPKNEGFGLALAATKSIMNIHSGEIKVANVTSGGASVTLSFPN